VVGEREQRRRAAALGRGALLRDGGVSLVQAPDAHEQRRPQRVQRHGQRRQFADVVHGGEAVLGVVDGLVEAAERGGDRGAVRPRGVDAVGRPAAGLDALGEVVERLLEPAAPQRLAGAGVGVLVADVGVLHAERGEAAQEHLGAGGVAGGRLGPGAEGERLGDGPRVGFGDPVELGERAAGLLERTPGPAQHARVPAGGPQVGAAARGVVGRVDAGERAREGLLRLDAPAVVGVGAGEVE